MWWVSQWGSQCASSRRRPSWTGGRKAFIVNVEVDRTPRRGGVGLSGGCCGGGEGAGSWQRGALSGLVDGVMWSTRRSGSSLSRPAGAPDCAGAAAPFGDGAVCRHELLRHTPTTGRALCWRRQAGAIPPSQDGDGPVCLGVTHLCGPNKIDKPTPHQRSGCLGLG